MLMIVYPTFLMHKSYYMRKMIRVLFPVNHQQLLFPTVRVKDKVLMA